MSRTVVVVDAAQRELKRLPKPIAERVMRAIFQYAVSGLGDVKHLSGKPNRWRLRVGDYRAIMDIMAEVITVLRVAHRREVYRDA